MIWNKVHLRPASETFHEFLIQVVLGTFGKTWRGHQRSLTAASRHVVIDWLDAWAEATRRTVLQTANTEHGSRFGVTASGPAVALISLGYDLFSLQAKNRLPEFLVERLRRNRGFQSARYEVAVSAIMVRAGFQVEHLDEVITEARHCEFIATCELTGFRLAVEAKSRVRPGVLHEPGEPAATNDARGFFNLLRAAGKQSVDKLPLVVFIDANVPPTPGIPLVEKPWICDMNAAADELERKADGKPAGDRHLLIAATNFGLHFGPHASDLAPREFGFIPTRGELAPNEVQVIERIIKSVRTYTSVPAEV